MFHHRNISAHALFGAADVPANGHFNTVTFRHGEFSARGIFGTGIFWHMDILGPCKAIWTFRQMCYCILRVSVQEIKPLGGHFACLRWEFDFYEVEKKILLFFKKEEGNLEYPRSKITLEGNALFFRDWAPETLTGGK